MSEDGDRSDTHRQIRPGEYITGRYEYARSRMSWHALAANRSIRVSGNRYVVSF